MRRFQMHFPDHTEESIRRLRYISRLNAYGNAVALFTCHFESAPTRRILYSYVLRKTFDISETRHSYDFWPYELGVLAIFCSPFLMHDAAPLTSYTPFGYRYFLSVFCFFNNKKEVLLQRLGRHVAHAQNTVWSRWSFRQTVLSLITVQTYKLDKHRPSGVSLGPCCKNNQNLSVDGKDQPIADGQFSPSDYTLLFNMQMKTEIVYIIGHVSCRRFLPVRAHPTFSNQADVQRIRIILSSLDNKILRI